MGSRTQGLQILKTEDSSFQIREFKQIVKMRDDVIVHTVLLLAIMASIDFAQSTQYGYQHYGGGYQPHYGGGYGYQRYMKPIYPGYNKGYGIYGTPPSVYGGYTTSKPPTGDEPDDQEPPAVSVFDPNSYVNNYMNRINMYTTAQNQYKTDRLNVKVNWNFQDGKYEYLRNQHGIHPQVHQPLRPFGWPYPRYNYPQYGYKKPYYGHHESHRESQSGGHHEPQQPQRGGQQAHEHGQEETFEGHQFAEDHE